MARRHGPRLGSLDLTSPGWTVVSRPATWWTRLYVRGMRARRDDRAFSGARRTRDTALARQVDGDAPPTRPTRLLLRLRLDVGPVPAWVARPRHRAPRCRVVHLHGGGYVHPLTADYWRLVRALVRAPAEVVVPTYPLAPHHDADEVLPALTALVASYADPRLPLVLVGDSAGGALALVLARRLLDAGTPAPPSLVVALSPWLDATLSDQEVEDLEPSDPMLDESGLRAAGRWWAGPRSPADPEVSPVDLPLAGLPPIRVLIGDRDILRPAVDRFAERARHVGHDLGVVEATAMFHVWMTRAVPEGRRTRRDLRRLLRRWAAR